MKRVTRVFNELTFSNTCVCEITADMNSSAFLCIKRNTKTKFTFHLLTVENTEVEHVFVGLLSQTYFGDLLFQKPDDVFRGMKL